MLCYNTIMATNRYKPVVDNIVRTACNFVPTVPAVDDDHLISCQVLISILH